ncbi:sulfatase-like hydrolase/transferase [Aestuariibacter sp. A3R04]|uniref:sulfatase-like hydrolase/transferase n=1 Tax=Aestuariibacter sp. A3R04 TaxID=2841571 RepID=UPI001C08D86C|nr:sulfatase-like hydrolase/transferase [Aestuariibacter sp. A3R04]MBU3021338.1 sulfatase-like hydrolase/transferase [Aestuariibacter sp. A3R04]
MKLITFSVLLCLFQGCLQHSMASHAPQLETADSGRPNILFIFADDLREDTLGINNNLLQTPHLDALAKQSLLFNKAYAVLAVCSPSRATVLTGRYPSVHGVTTYGDTPINQGLPTFVQTLRDKGYLTGVTGKWHVGNSPQDMGFTSADIFHANGAWYGREVIENGKAKIYPGFVETWSVDRSIDFLTRASETQKPFFLWYNTQVPHMDDEFSWPATEQSLASYRLDDMPLPLSYPPDHTATGKPPYLRESRSYTRAMNTYGYQSPDNLKAHIRDYYAAVTDMDREIGRLLNALKRQGLDKNTYIIFMSDNGWLLGEHGLTSKVLAYKPSMQVPLFVSGPDIPVGENNGLVSNVDLAPFILDLAGISPDYRLDGASFNKLLSEPASQWREYVYYESPTPQLIPRSFFAIRDADYLYIETYSAENPSTPEFVELYASRDPAELTNLALTAENTELLQRYATQLRQAREHYASP